MNPKLLNERTGALAALAMLMALTRFHHEGTAFALPDASLAVFFLAGFYLGRASLFLALLAEAAAIDYLAIAQLGVSDYCVSPAYVFLLPTYGLMWLAGRWLSRQERHPWAVYLGLAAASLLVSASAAFVVSNGSFYLFSGKLAGLGLADYASDLAGQYLPYVGAAAFYAALGLGAGSLLRALTATRKEPMPVNRL